MFGVLGVPNRLNDFNKIDKMDSKIGFEMSLIVVEAIRGRCASFMILTATVRRYLVDRQIQLFLVLYMYDSILRTSESQCWAMIGVSE